jgi:hypothetical protein
VIQERTGAAPDAGVEGPPLSVSPMSLSKVNAGSWPRSRKATGQVNRTRCVRGGGWRFVEPQTGISVWNREDSFQHPWNGSWRAGETDGTTLCINGPKLLGERLPTLTSPSGGTIIDEQARTAVQSVIATLKSHGLSNEDQARIWS